MQDKGEYIERTVVPLMSLLAVIIGAPGGRRDPSSAYGCAPAGVGLA
jgi:hypothetical protein